MKLTEETTATAAKAPTKAMIAGCTNFRIDRCAEDLFAPGLLSTLTEGGVERASKKSSVSPLIHLLMSLTVMLGIPEFGSVRRGPTLCRSDSRFQAYRVIADQLYKLGAPARCGLGNLS